MNSIQSGSQVDELAKEVLNVYEKVKFDQSWEEPEIFNYEKIKNKIVFRLVQRSRNEEFLKEIPHVPILDLEIIFYIHFRDNQRRHGFHADQQ